MSLEIERKFLVDGDFKTLSTGHDCIRQGYIFNAGGRSVRVRQRGERGYLTIKGPVLADGISRYEFEKEIDLQESKELMLLCEPGIIDKVRWIVPFDNHVFEVDEFFGENAGLVVAEVELKSPEESVCFPPFIGREVTGDRRYYNGSLRRYPYQMWKDTVK